MDDAPPQKPLSATISMTRRINTAKYESADVFISISGITHETTDEDVITLCDGPVQDTFKILRERLVAKTRDIRAKGGE